MTTDYSCSRRTAAVFIQSFCPAKGNFRQERIFYKTISEKGSQDDDDLQFDAFTNLLYPYFEVLEFRNGKDDPSNEDVQVFWIVRKLQIEK